MDLDHYKYITVDEAACQAKPGFWLVKVDLKHAYQSVGTHPNSWKVTGMSWHFEGTATCTINASLLVLEPLPWFSTASRNPFAE